MSADAPIVWTVIGIVFSTMCGLLTFSYRKLYNDLEKIVQKHDGELATINGRIHEIAVQLAEGKSVAHAVAELKDEVRGMRKDLYKVARSFGSEFPSRDNNR